MLRSAGAVALAPAQPGRGCAAEESAGNATRGSGVLVGAPVPSDPPIAPYHCPDDKMLRDGKIHPMQILHFDSVEQV